MWAHDHNLRNKEESQYRYDDIDDTFCHVTNPIYPQDTEDAAQSADDENGNHTNATA
jgi:hypothetical protein